MALFRRIHAFLSLLIESFQPIISSPTVAGAAFSPSLPAILVRDNSSSKRKKEKDSGMAKLCECEYLTENDYDYFRNDEEWIERLRYRALNDYEVTQLIKLMSDLKTSSMAHIHDLFSIGPLKFYFDKTDFAYVNRVTTPLPPNTSLTTATGLPYTASQDKFQVKAAFVATIIRYLILQDENVDLAENDRQTFLSKYPFLGEQVGTSIELTWLNRFERSLRYMKRFVTPERNKILYLTVGNHLEGSTLYTTYITGGQNRPETERRVKIFDALCQVQPRKRAKRVSESSNGNNSPNTNQATSANTAALTAEERLQGGNQEPKRQKRQYNKRVKLSAEAALTMSSHSSSASLSVEGATNTLALFQGMLSHQSSMESTESSIPYELSVLLAAVETQIKEEDVNFDENDSAVDELSQSEEKSSPSPPKRGRMTSRVSSYSSLSRASSMDQ